MKHIRFIRIRKIRGGECPNCGFQLNEKGTCPRCGFCGG